MECKFKQISHLKNECSMPVPSSQTAVNETINQLLSKVGDHVYNKTAMEKSKIFLKNKIVSFEVDSVKQVYQPRPIMPHSIMEEDSPRKGVADSLRPMSAQIRHNPKTHQRSSINNSSDSKKTIASYASFSGQLRTKRNTASIKSMMETSNKNSKRNYTKKNQENGNWFFAVKSNSEDDDVNFDFIEELRLKKKQEENEVKKKEEFLKSIQLQSASYSSAQAKFIQSISRKKFIYGQQGQIIEIKGIQQKLHLKKISAMSKSRVEIKSKTTDLKKFEEDLKENIYIEFKGRESHQSRPEASNVQKDLQKAQQSKNNSQKIFSAKQTKRQTEDGPNAKINKKLDDQIKVQLSARNKQLRGSIQTEKGSSKKKIEKILFYPSENSVYKVVNEGSVTQSNNGLVIEDI